MTEIRPTILRPAQPRSGWQVAVGLLLVLPALILLITSYVEPTVWTIRSGFGQFTGIRIASGTSGSGLDNYHRIFDAGLTDTFRYALTLAFVPFLAVVLLAPLLAWAAHRGGKVSRWVTRGVLVLPLAAFAPVAVAVAQRLDQEGLKPDQIASAARSTYWWEFFGVATALGVTVFLAALRRREERRSPWPALVVGAVLAGLAVIAAALQEFTVASVFGAPANVGATPVRMAFDLSFRDFRFGPGAAVSTLLIAVLAGLGLLATVLVVLTGLRLEVDEQVRSADEPSGAPVVGRVIAGGLLLGVLLIGWSVLHPWLAHVTDDGAVRVATAVNTWVPPLISTVIGVTVAALAAFGISWLRPFGRHSEWLLVPFGLFLFVGVGPFALRALAAGATAGRLGTLLALVPPTLVAIPALFVLALLLRGQALRRETLLQESRPAPVGRLLLPVLPMLGLAYLVTWLVQAQDLLWPYVSATGRWLTGNVALLQAAGGVAPGRLPYARVLPLGLLILLVAVGVAAQLLYLDRVALRLGRPERDHPPRT